MSDHAAGDDSIFLPEPAVRRALVGRRVRLRVLVPPYPALGVGTLRVLRVRDSAAETELLAGYDGYVRP